MALRSLTAAAAVTAACIEAAASAPRRAQGSIPGVWLPPSTSSASSWVIAGSDPTSSSSTAMFICQAMDAVTGVTVTGRRDDVASPTCSFAVSGAVRSNSVYTMLAASSSMGWMTPTQTGPNMDAVVAGVITGGTVVYVCRGSVSPFRQPGLAFPGWTITMPTGLAGGVCNVASSSGLSTTTAVFDYLVMSRGGAPPPPLASPAAPAATPSSSPVPPATAVWMPGSTTAITMGLIAGVEDSSTMYVCMGNITAVAPSVVMMGKYETAVGACNVPYNGVEVTARTFSVLRSSSWLLWQSAPFVFGSRPVCPVSDDTVGYDLCVCRAWHPTRRTGPHPGTLLSNATGMFCLFSYGGRVITVSSPNQFDTLFLINADRIPASMQAVASVVPAPSASPSPSVTPSVSASVSGAPPGIAMWMPAAVLLSSGAAAMQSGTRTSNNPIYVCRSALASGDVVPGRWEAVRGVCEIPGNGNVVIRTDLLLRSPYLLWTSDPSTIPGAVPVVAGAVQGMNVTVCRAYRSSGSGGFTGPDAGALLPGTSACVFNVSGALVAASPLQILVVVQSIPGNWTATMPALPSPSPSPSPSPTSSASLAPVVPGLLPQWLPGDTFAVESGLVQTGMDVNKAVYVCRGTVADGYEDAMPGKWISPWNFCDVPYRNVEQNDRAFDVLRTNPWHTWVPINGTAPVGAVKVSGGIFLGSQAYVCRAMHRESGSGPHGGYTDWEMYGPYRICIFSYGGGVKRTEVFDYLVMAPPASPSVTPSVPGSASMPPSVVPSIIASSSSSPSATASRSVQVPSSTPTPSTSGTASPSPSVSPAARSASATTSAAASPSSTASMAVLPPSASATASRTRSPAPAVDTAATGAQASAPNTTGLAVGLSVAIGVVVLGGAYWIYRGRTSRAAGPQRLGAERAAGASSRPRAEPEAVTAANDAFKDDLAAMTAGAGGARSTPVRAPGARSANV